MQYQLSRCLKKAKTNDKGTSDYSAEFLGSDNTTKGNWASKYGKKGYHMFNYFGEGMDNVATPDFVQVTIFSFIFFFDFFILSFILLYFFGKRAVEEVEGELFKGLICDMTECFLAAKYELVRRSSTVSFAFTSYFLSFVLFCDCFIYLFDLK